MVRRLALHDRLTGLPNRTLLHDRLGQELAHARREGSMVAVLLLDLDRFKDVNDTLGHPVGDQLLCAVAQRITAAVRATDTLARLGGDEFAARAAAGPPAPPTWSPWPTRSWLRSPRRSTSTARRSMLSTSIGIALFPQDGQDPDTLLKHAELALYRAKAQGRGQFRFFEPAMDDEAQARRRLERELRQALERGEFVLHYQPQLELASGRLVGVEALVRWNHPERGLVPPGAFIPAAEANGLIRPLGAWVLREACRQATVWRERGWDLSVAVNLSPAQLRHSQLLPTDRRCARGGRARAGPARARDHRRRADGELRAAGRRLPAGPDGRRRAAGARRFRHRLQLARLSASICRSRRSRSTARSCATSARIRDALALVRAIVTLGHSLRKRVVAEGVENATQLALLRELGCDEAQGFHIARPLDAEQFADLLASQDTSISLACAPYWQTLPERRCGPCGTSWPAPELMA